MGALSITLKDLQIFLKDRGAVVMLFLLPFVFISMLSIVGKNVDLGQSAEEALSLKVANSDPDGALSKEYLADLEKQGVVRLEYDDQAYLEKRINDANLGMALFVPQGFSADLEAGRQVSLRLLMHPYANEAAVMTVERALVRTAREFMMMQYLNQGLKQMAAMQAADPQSASTFSEERIQGQIASQQAQAENRPLISVTETTPQALLDEEEGFVIPELGQTIVLGMAVLFVFLSAQNTAASIFREKEIGSFRRLIAAPLGRPTILIGKLLPNLILSLVQIAVIFLTGVYLLGFLGVTPLDLGSDPLGLVIVALAAALCSTCLGIFIAGIARTQNQVGSFSSLFLFLAALLAGSFVPQFLLPDGLNSLAHVVPHYWANHAFFGLVFRNNTLAQVWPDVAALLAFSAGFFAIGAWRFKFD